MAFSVGTIEGKVVLNYDNKGLRSLDKDLKTAGKSIDQTDSKAKRLGGSLKSGLKVGAAAAGTALVGGLAYGLKQSIVEAREAEKVTRRTENVIKSTGGVANVTAKQIGTLTTQISNKAAIDDEAIQSGANLLLTFKNIRNEQGKGNNIFSQTTSIMTDMSVAMDQSMKSSAIQLGKALNDPIKGLSALSRVGVQFSDQQEKMIEKLVKGGKTMEAQKIILKELNSQFGGAAASQADPMQRLTTIFNNFLETVGSKLLPYINRAANALSRFLLQMTSGKGAGGQFTETLKNIWNAIKGIVPIFLTMGKALGSIIKWFAGLSGTMQTAIAAFAGVFAVAMKLMTFLRVAPLMAGPIGIALAGLATAAYLIINNWGKIKPFLGKLWNWIKGAFSTVAGVVNKLARYGFLGPVGLIISRWGELKNFLGNAWGWIKKAFGNVVGFVVKMARSGFLGPVPLIISRWEQIVGFFKSLPGKIASLVSGIGRVIFSPFKWAFDKIKGLFGKVGGFLGKINPFQGGFPGFAEGGIVGPGAGGPKLFLAGEGNAKEFVISTEGPRDKNMGYLKEAAEALGIPAFRKGGKVSKRAVEGIQNRLGIYSGQYQNKRRQFELSGGELTDKEFAALEDWYVKRVKLTRNQAGKPPTAGLLNRMGFIQLHEQLIKWSKGQDKAQARVELQSVVNDLTALRQERQENSAGLKDDLLDKMIESLIGTNFDETISDLQTQLAIAEAGYGGDANSLRGQLKTALEGRLGLLRERLAGNKNPQVVKALRDAIMGTLSDLSGVGSGGGFGGGETGVMDPIDQGPSLIQQSATAAALRYGLFSGMGGNAAFNQLGAGGKMLSQGPRNQVFLNGEFKLDSNDPHASVRRLGDQLAMNLA